MADVIAERYSQALFDLAREKNLLEETSEDVLFVQSLMGDHPELYRFLELPDVSVDRKKQAMAHIVEGSVRQPMAGLLQLLIQKARIPYLAEILDGYQDMLRDTKGQVQVWVTTAVELSAEELQKIVRTLEKSLHKEILAEQVVDPSVLGGVIVRVGDKVFDNSIRSSLERLSKHLKTFRMQEESC